MSSTTFPAPVQHLGLLRTRLARSVAARQRGVRAGRRQAMAEVEALCAATEGVPGAEEVSARLAREAVPGVLAGPLAGRATWTAGLSGAEAVAFVTLGAHALALSGGGPRHRPGAGVGAAFGVVSRQRRRGRAVFRDFCGWLGADTLPAAAPFVWSLAGVDAPVEIDYARLGCDLAAWVDPARLEDVRRRLSLEYLTRARPRAC